MHKCNPTLMNSSDLHYIQGYENGYDAGYVDAFELSNETHKNYVNAVRKLVSYYTRKGRAEAFDMCISTIREEFAECGYIADSLERLKKGSINNL